MCSCQYPQGSSHHKFGQGLRYQSTHQFGHASSNVQKNKNIVKRKIRLK